MYVAEQYQSHARVKIRQSKQEKKKQRVPDSESDQKMQLFIPPLASFIVRGRRISVADVSDPTKQKVA